LTSIKDIVFVLVITVKETIQLTEFVNKSSVQSYL